MGWGDLITRITGWARTRLIVAILMSLGVALPIDVRGQYLETVGQYLTGYYGDVAPLDHYLVAQQGDGLVILDIADPAKPTVNRDVPLSIQPARMTLKGGMAYILGYDILDDPVLLVVDLTDLLNPRLRGMLPLPNPAPDSMVSLDVVQGRAYVLRDGVGLTIVDVNDPDRPTVLGQDVVRELDSLYMVKVRGNLAYISDGVKKTLVLDVTNPATPVKKNLIGYSPVAMVFADNLAYLASAAWDSRHAGQRQGLQILDLGNPTSPTLRGCYPVAGTGDNIPLDLCVNGGRAYMAALTGGLLVFDVINPAAPTLVSSSQEPNLQPVGLTLVGTTACLVDGTLSGGNDLPTNGLYFLDISDPAHPKRQVALLAAGAAEGVAIDGMQACLSHGANGVSLIDISDPDHPITLGQCDTPGEAQGVALVNGLAYVADGDHGLQVVDVKTPGRPTLKGAVTLAGPAEKVAVANGRAYVAVQGQGMDIVDVANPAAPKRLGGTGAAAAGCRDVAVAGSQAYVPCATGLAIYDVSDPERLMQVHRIETPTTVTGVAVLGQTLVVTTSADPDAGSTVQFYDVKDPGTPRLLGQYARPLTQSGRAVALDSGLAGVIYNDGLNGRLSLVDTSTPAAPQPIGTIPFSTGLNQAVLANGLIYAATGTGLSILRPNANLAHVQLLSPNMGPLLGGSTIKIGWKTDLAVAGSAVKLQLVRDGEVVEDLGSDQAAGGTGEKLLYLPPQPGQHDYRIRVSSAAQPGLYVESLDPLIITGGPIRIVSPDSASWTVGEEARVEWAGNLALVGSTVDLALYKGDQLVAELGTFMDPLGHGASRFIVPAVAPGGGYQLRLYSKNDRSLMDACDGSITIVARKNAVMEGMWSLYP